MAWTFASMRRHMTVLVSRGHHSTVQLVLRTPIFGEWAAAAQSQANAKSEATYGSLTIHLCL